MVRRLSDGAPLAARGAPAEEWCGVARGAVRISSVSLSGNQLIDYGHSLAAAVLTMQGNRLINRGAQSGPAPIGRFVTNRAALTGNVAEMGEDFSFVTVAANILGDAGNVVVVSKI